MKAKVYRMEVMVVDHEGLDVDSVIYEVEKSKYAHIRVLDLESKSVEWDDDNPLNHADTQRAALREVFS